MGFWDIVFINPMINGLIVLERLLGNFGLAIIAFTVLVRAAILPLTLRQLHASRKMMAITPQVQEIQKKYKDPKRRQEETMKLYREAGVNPIGCLGPMIIQFPIFIALYRVLTLTVGGTPERTAELAHRLYPWSFIQDAVPLSSRFLGIDLGRQDAPILMFILVWATTWLQTKTTFSQQSAATMTPQQRQTNQLMLWWMPTLFAWFTFSVPSGLSMYWVVTNIIGIIMNWFVYGWHKRPLRELFITPTTTSPARRRPKAEAGTRGSPAVSSGRHDTKQPSTRASADRSTAEKRTPDGKGGDKRKDGGGGGDESAPPARSRPLPSRRRNR